MSTYRERITGLQWPVYYEDVETLRRIGFEDAKELAAEIAAEADAALAERDALIERLAGALDILNKRPRPLCRDCADNDGTCPNSGLPCDMAGLIAQARATYHQQRKEGGE